MRAGAGRRACTIVGVGPGLGAAIAERFAAGGHRVRLVARTDRVVRPLAERLGGVWATADAGDARALTGTLADLDRRGGGPAEVLIYNAAVLRPGGALAVSPDRVRAEFETNVIGALVCARHAAPAMAARGRGAILLTGGGLALEPYPEWTSLALGKAALRSLAISLHKELAPAGVHVAVVAVCGLVAPGGPFDPAKVAETYWRLATCPDGVRDREAIVQPPGTDPHYNDPDRRHGATSVTPPHART